jgi:NADH dehydrogenase
LQPIYVDDLAAAVVALVEGKTNETIDAIGPETFRYRGLVEMIANEIGSRALIGPMPPWLAFLGVRMLGWMVGDVINTRDEVKGLMQERLYVESPPLGTTKLSDWVHAHREKLGRRYVSELQRRFDRVSPYRPN